MVKIRTLSFTHRVSRSFLSCRGTMFPFCCCSRLPNTGSRMMMMTEATGSSSSRTSPPSTFRYSELDRAMACLRARTPGAVAHQQPRPPLPQFQKAKQEEYGGARASRWVSSAATIVESSSRINLDTGHTVQSLEHSNRGGQTIISRQGCHICW